MGWTGHWIIVDNLALKMQECEHGNRKGTGKQHIASKTGLWIGDMNVEQVTVVQNRGSGKELPKRKLWMADQVERREQ